MEFNLPFSGAVAAQQPASKKDLRNKSILFEKTSVGRGAVCLDSRLSKAVLPTSCKQRCSHGVLPRSFLLALLSLQALQGRPDPEVNIKSGCRSKVVRICGCERAKNLSVTLRCIANALKGQGQEWVGRSHSMHATTQSRTHERTHAPAQSVRNARTHAQTFTLQSPSHKTASREEKGPSRPWGLHKPDACGRSPGQRPGQGPP